MRIGKLLLAAGVAAVLLAGCGNANDEKAANQAAEQPDVVTTASLVNDSEAFVNAVGENGTWIIATLGDLAIDKEIVVAGEFHDKNDASKDIYRKIALYAQDEDHNITAQYTLTVPKMTVKSENLRIQGGKVKGDVFVEANGFNLHGTATVDGNLVFANADVQATAVIEGTVTGTTGVQ